MNTIKKILLKIFRITPLRLSVTITFTFFIMAVWYDINPRNIPLLQTLEQKSLDVKFRIRGPVKPKNKIVIVGADEKSFQKFGQWPFDRADVFAPALENICKLDPKAVGMDIVWTDPEKPLPSRVRQSLVTALGSKPQKLDKILSENSGDQRLRKAIENCGDKIVLGYALGSSDGQNGISKKDFEKRLKALQQGNNLIDARLSGGVKFSRWPGDPEGNVDFYALGTTGTLNIPTLTPPSVAQGFFNNEPENDGNYRRALLAFKAGDFFVPSLPLRMAQKGFEKKEIRPKLTIQASAPEEGIPQEFQLELPTSAGTLRIPADTRGQALVNFRGPNYTFPHVSLADLLSSSSTIEYQEANDLGFPQLKKIHKSELFKDAFVIVGVTALALYDIRPRPLAEDAFGVENHANILDNILNNDFLYRPTSESILKFWLTILLVSLLFGLILTKLDAKWGAAFSLTSIAGLLYFDQHYLFKNNIVFLGAFQALQFSFQYIAITILKYMQEEKDKKFIRSAFDKYVSPAIVDSMIKDPSKLKLGGDKKEISVLFSDIAGFTELSERIDVKDLTQFLNEYLGSMTDILQKNSGTLDKYIGDAVMGFWGAPVDMPNHASLAVKTAIEMIQKLNELNTRFKEKYNGLEIDIRVGINSGPVSVGNFGSNKVFSYTVIGDNVNLASRLEGVNKYYGTSIMISQSTKQLLKKGEFLIREVDTVKVKGKHKPVKIYQVIPELPEMQNLKSALSKFNDGLENYYGQRWQEAKAAFEAVLKTVSNDKPTSELLRRIEYYTKNPPHKDWDGSWEMTSK